MAIGISSSTSSSAGGAGGLALEAQRAAIAARRRESPEAREEAGAGLTARGGPETVSPQERVSEAPAARELRQDRVRLSQVTDEPQRPAIAAYLGVERATPSDVSFGELLGIDIYV